MDALLKYPLESEGKKFGSCVISMMEHGSWKMQIEIDFSSLPEHDDFQKTTGKIGNRPEVIAICQVVNKVFTEHNKDEVVALYTSVKKICHELTKVLEAVGFKQSGSRTKKDGRFIYYEYVRPISQ